MEHSPWTDILSAAELSRRYAITESLDPCFAADQRAFYETRTLNQLRALMQQAWNCNEADAYQLARSYSTLAGG